MKPLRVSTLFLLSLLAAATLLTACSPKATPVPTATATPDPCAPANIVTEVKKVNDLQRAFDDAAQLAAVTRLTDLTNVVPSMQDLRRQAQDQQVPPCLATLKTLQLQEMNATINTFLAFMANSSATPNAVLAQGVALANSLHQQYIQELARLIGATYIPPSQSTGTPGTLLPTNATSPAVTPTTATVTNPGTASVNLRAKPALDAQTLGNLQAGQSTAAIGKTADGQWIAVQDGAGTIAWVYASLVQLTAGDALPVVTPAP